MCEVPIRLVISTLLDFSYGSDSPASIGIAGDRQRQSTLFARVCRACGFAELYADEPERL